MADMRKGYRYFAGSPIVRLAISKEKLKKAGTHSLMYNSASLETAVYRTIRMVV